MLSELAPAAQRLRHQWPPRLRWALAPRQQAPAAQHATMRPRSAPYQTPTPQCCAPSCASCAGSTPHGLRWRPPARRPPCPRLRPNRRIPSIRRAAPASRHATLRLWLAVRALPAAAVPSHAWRALERGWHQQRSLKRSFAAGTTSSHWNVSPGTTIRQQRQLNHRVTLVLLCGCQADGSFADRALG